MIFGAKRFAVWLVAAAGMAVSSTVAAESSPCPANMGSYRNLEHGQSIKCTCPAVEGRGPVWGAERFTVDSDVCRAAVHAGAVPAAGGEVTVYLAEGCPIFRGTAKNGVQSLNFGPYRRTYHFAKEAPACSVQTKDDPVVDCPFTMSTFAHMKKGQTWRCRCPEKRLGGRGTVFGTDRYTTDSSTCHAARHAGAVQASGGEVTVHTGEGCARYTATQKNGVGSREWKAFLTTFGFANPLPACAN